MRCPKCGLDLPADFNFCEVDGTPLHSLNALEPDTELQAGISCHCEIPVVSPDRVNFCGSCKKEWSTTHRDHIEYQRGAHLAAVSDRGLRHADNQDDVRIAMEIHNGERYYITVVCDGLSSCQRASEASSCAAQNALDALLLAVRSDFSRPERCMQSAIMKAHESVCTLTYDKDGSGEPPGTTIVAAVTGASLTTIGWIGDSRAYLLSDTACLLTRDHSWINQAVETGYLTPAAAQLSARAHAVTQCLGTAELLSSGAAPRPSVVSSGVERGSWLILCSDGLWNYAEQPDHIHALVKGTPPGEPQALAVARHLVAFAVSQGGRDNITVTALSTGCD